MHTDARYRLRTVGVQAFCLHHTEARGRSVQTGKLWKVQAEGGSVCTVTNKNTRIEVTKKEKNTIKVPVLLMNLLQMRTF